LVVDLILNLGKTNYLLFINGFVKYSQLAGNFENGLRENIEKRYYCLKIRSLFWASKIKKASWKRNFYVLKWENL
jgi:hypothetical protein